MYICTVFAYTFDLYFIVHDLGIPEHRASIGKGKVGKGILRDMEREGNYVLITREYTPFLIPLPDIPYPLMSFSLYVKIFMYTQNDWFDPVKML